MRFGTVYANAPPMGQLSRARFCGSKIGANIAVTFAKK
jgi:hypothetical protein